MKSCALFLKCYRQQFGDVSVPDVLIPAEPLGAAKVTAAQNLLNWFGSNRLRAGENPHSAALVARDGKVVATFMVRPNADHGGYQVEELPIPEPRTIRRISP